MYQPIVGPSDNASSMCLYNVKEHNLYTHFSGPPEKEKRQYLSEEVGPSFCH